MPLFRETLRLRELAYEPDHRYVTESLYLVGDCLRQLGRFEEAEPLLLRSFELSRDSRGIESGSTQSALQRLVSLYQDWDRPESAEQYEELLETTG